MAGMSAGVDELAGWESLSPQWRERLRAADLPAALLKVDSTACFLLGPDLAAVDVPPLGHLLRFGYAIGLFAGEFCVELATGAVRLIRADLPSVFVNSSLDQFGRSLRLALRYERVLTADDIEACADAAAEIRAGIAKIDPAADDTDTYWDLLYYELVAGTYLDFE